MTTFFVRTTGSDAADGSTGTPWLTLTKALTTCAAGDTIKVGTGTYAENSSGTGRWNIIQVFASVVTVQSETGLQDVTVTGASDAAINTIVNAAATNLAFVNITFAMRANTTSHALRLAQAALVTFTTCVFTCLTNNVQVNNGVRFQPGAAVAVTATFNNCTFNCTGTDIARDVETGWTAGNTITATFTNCTMTCPEDCIGMNGGTVTVTGGSYTSTAAHTLRFGADSNTGGNATTATVTGARIVCSTGHGLLFGNACTGCTAQGNKIDGGDHAIVMKEHTGTIVTGNYLNKSNTAEIYFKAAVSCTASLNVLDTTGLASIKLNAGDTGNKCQNCTFTQNWMKNSGNTSAGAFSWAPAGATDDLGGSVCDQNIFDIHTGNFGTIGAVTAIKNLPGVLAAWATYGVASNDNRSRNRKARRVSP